LAVDRIYPIGFEIKDTTDTGRPASYFDIHLEIDSEGRLRTKLYDKRDNFNFPVVNFPFMCSNIPAATAYGMRKGPGNVYKWNISVVICNTDIP
jgi:hypothetical protein